MAFDCFREYPGEARLWVYAFPQDLNHGDRTIVKSMLTRFCADWQSHDDPVDGGFTIYRNRFVLLVGVVDGGPSGCSIDSSTQVMKYLAHEHDLNALDPMLIHYEHDGRIESVSRSVFDERCSGGKVSKDTVVYNCALQTLGELRDGKFETRFCDSWHASAFALNA